jgi:cupin fold WbuC family metalloprotein
MMLLSNTLLDELVVRAQGHPRRRAHHNIHASPTDLVQRFVVVALRDSYFRPHRHRTKSELATVLRGDISVLTFDGSGRVTARFRVGAGTDSIAYETAQDTWHTLIPGEAGTAFLEVKQGPYDATTASEFAAWAPPEGDAAAAGFMAWLRDAQPGSMPPG